jgi:hypothetical protein
MPCSIYQEARNLILCHSITGSLNVFMYDVIRELVFLILTFLKQHNLPFRFHFSY